MQPDDDRIVNQTLTISAADQIEAGIRDVLGGHGLVAADFFEVSPADTQGTAADLLLKLGAAAVDAQAGGALLALVGVPGADGLTGAAWIVVQREQRA
jgi:hypothetical protein